jgi:sugar lactone lactonase YvrE
MKYMKNKKTILLISFFVFWVSFASSIVEFSGYDYFLNCKEIRNLSITAEGKVMLGPEISLFYNTEESYIWSLIQDKKSNIYAGTGSEGKIFRITPDGKGKIFFDCEETEILSLALDNQGNLYAGTAPKGIIYKISPAGKGEKFFETNENYVYSMVFDDKGFLYIGTGDKGNIYRIDSKGNGKIIYDSPEPHIVSLVLTQKPKPFLYAGTSGQGLIYKISNLESKPEVMTIYDSAEEEIRSLLIAKDGSIFCGANPGDTKSGISKSNFSEKKKVPGFIPKIYRLSPEGIVKQSWSALGGLDSVIFAMQTSGKEILVGTGNNGRIYQLDQEEISKGLGTLLLTINEPQVTVFGPSSTGSVLIGTGNPGKIYRLKTDMKQEGWIITEPFDSKTISEWGKLIAEAEIPSGTSIEWQTRSGNSENPDETWSEFQSLTADGDIQSPSARFLQRKAIFNSNQNQTPILSRVKISYLSTNLAPVVFSVEINQDGEESDDIIKPAGPSLRRQDRKITWTAFDPNGDSMRFSLYYKGAEEKEWKLLSSDLKEKNYILDSEMLPDGKYQTKVVASDKPSQPFGSELSGERTSDWFEIDNTSPRVTDIKAEPKQKKYLITFSVSDQSSIIKNCEYSFNASKWQALSPKDKIFDTKSEAFSFEIELGAGENTIVIRAYDAFKNIGSGKIVVRVK